MHYLVKLLNNISNVMMHSQSIKHKPMNDHLKGLKEFVTQMKSSVSSFNQ